MIQVKRSYKRAHLAAFGVDLYRVYSHGSFAHTNFLRVPSPVFTCNCNNVPRRPEDVLNEFGSYHMLCDIIKDGCLLTYQYDKEEKCIIMEESEQTSPCKTSLDGLMKVDARDVITSAKSYYKVKKYETEECQ